MKKRISIICLSAAISSIAADKIIGNYNTSLGYLAGKTASGTKVTAVGAGSDAISTGNEECSFVGAASGVMTTNNYYSVGVGYRSMRGSKNNSNCIAIGNYAGSESSGAVGGILIGNYVSDGLGKLRSNSITIGNGETPIANVINIGGRLIVDNAGLKVDGRYVNVNTNITYNFHKLGSKSVSESFYGSRTVNGVSYSLALNVYYTHPATMDTDDLYEGRMWEEVRVTYSGSVVCDGSQGTVSGTKNFQASGSGFYPINDDNIDTTTPQGLLNSVQVYFLTSDDHKKITYYMKYGSQTAVQICQIPFTDKDPFPDHPMEDVIDIEPNIAHTNRFTTSAAVERKVQGGYIKITNQSIFFYKADGTLVKELATE